MRIAVIADIHGNVLALEAVLKDIASRRVDMTIDLGDCVSGPLWPRETFELLDTLKFPTVRGNHDRALGGKRSNLGSSDAYAATALAPAAMAEAGSWEKLALSELPPAACLQLANLPPTLVPAPGVLAFHASPAADTTYFIDTVKDGELVAASLSDIAQRIEGTTASLLLCGHSHIARMIACGAQLVVNPGSVGCPGYIDDGTPYHVSEAGSPHARYAIVDNVSGSWAVEFLAVTYDWARAAERALANNRPEWAMALATGRVR